MSKSVTATIADVEFDRVEYDADADVLYLHVGDPSPAVEFDETPEGHAVRFDRDGKLIGLTLVRLKPRGLLAFSGGTAALTSSRRKRSGTPAIR